jgi:hypothetical protein
VALRVNDHDNENDDNKAELGQSNVCEHSVSSPHPRLRSEYNGPRVVDAP